MRQSQSPTIVTQCDRLKEILQRVSLAAASDTSILLVGETGVGKELFADHVHRCSPRHDRPLVKISLSAMPHELLESELFGHERGAFTSAVTEKKGLFELAQGGTLFLDDIDDVPASIQPKLLRALESREVLRVGGVSPTPIDVRLITASKVDLMGLVDRGLFRADLYYRINVVPVLIPPLRDRREDVPVLFEHFLTRFSPGAPPAVTPAAQQQLSAYSWPGNIRELRNIAQRLALFAGSVIDVRDLPTEVRDGQSAEVLARACLRCFSEDSMTFNDVVGCLEATLLRQALEDADGNRSRAARALHLSLSTLRDKLRKYGLDQDEVDTGLGPGQTRAAPPS